VDFREQATLSYENLKAAIESSTAKWKILFNFSAFVTDMRALPIYREVDDKFVNVVAPPPAPLSRTRNLQSAPLEAEAIAVSPAH
jgi:enamine deaminase RidA (YjgF/YER057c/UK114 family)